MGKPLRQRRTSKWLTPLLQVLGFWWSSHRPRIQPLLTAMRYAIRHNLGDVLSLSFGVGERCLSAASRGSLHAVLEDARSHHISVVASAGDNGSVAPMCSRTLKHIVSSVDLPATDPLVTAIGGTTLDASAGVETISTPSTTSNSATMGLRALSHTAPLSVFEVSVRVPDGMQFRAGALVAWPTSSRSSLVTSEQEMEKGCSAG